GPRRRAADRLARRGRRRGRLDAVPPAGRADRPASDPDRARRQAARVRRTARRARARARDPRIGIAARRRTDGGGVNGPAFEDGSHPLARFQDAFLRALLSGAPAPIGDATIAGLCGQPGFAVYRNTAIKGCIDALAANYPSVARP